MNQTRKPRVVAVIQARMGSTRLPGKVLRPLAAKPVLWHVIHRVAKAKSIDAVSVATSVEPGDDAIEAFCREHDIPCIRGPEANVLQRFALAADAMDADIIVRVTGDAVFVDADFIDYLVTQLIAADGDYVYIEAGALCAHEGVDPFSRRALRRLTVEAADDPAAREHVTGYFKLHPDFGRGVYVPAYPPLAVEPARISIDAPADLAFAEAVYERLGAKAGEASLPDVLQLLERAPELRAINAGVRQKAIRQVGGIALIFCDGGGAFGYGHIRRCLNIARALRDREGLGVVFALNGTEDAAAQIRDAGFEAIILPERDQVATVSNLMESRKPRLLLVDTRSNVTRADIAHFTSLVKPVAVIDDGSDRRLAATHAYYAPLPQVKALSWSGSACTVRSGWEWALTGLDISSIPERSPYDGPPRLLVTMGASDPKDFTRLALQALSQVSAPFRARFVIGPSFRDADALRREIEARGYELVPPGHDLRESFATADVALIAFGVTAYEMAALGVPAIYLAISDDHAASASAFEAAGMGVLAQSHAAGIRDALAEILAAPTKRTAMGQTARGLIDGMGAQRIAADLASATI